MKTWSVCFISLAAVWKSTKRGRFVWMWANIDTSGIHIGGDTVFDIKELVLGRFEV